MTGRTVEEAKDAALDQLGVDEQDAEFEVLEEPRPGLFGRLRSEARVRARVLPTTPRPKIDHRRERRRRPGRDSRDARPKAESRPPRAPAERAERDGEPVDEPSLEEQGETARAFVEGLVQAFDLEAQVATRALDEDTIEVAVTGEGLGVLIGPKAETLGAVQELARTVVQRQVSGRSGRIVVDVAAYRQKRREALERFTRGVADDVKSSGVARVLEAMPPADRKVVHDTVNEIPGVSTSSEGEEPRRRVVITPDGA